MDSKTLCTASRRNGEPCLNYAIKGATVCRMHGGSAPQVRRAAQVRILMASDLAAKKMVELMSNPKVDDRVKLAAAKDLLDRANLAGTQNIEVGVTKRTFEDFVGDALVDAAEDDDSNVWDAEVIDDDDTTPLVPRDEVQNRHDRAVFAEVERNHSRRARPGDKTDEQRARAEADLLAEQRHAEHLEHQAEIDRQREAVLLAKMNGTYNPSSRGDAMREAADKPGRKRRTRVRDGGFGDS
ncbi:HGGxSTG domain-containing protein [Microbacterium sp. NPDC077057]|uniref:HGGxSTG domain-containing protein n=1 Tax=Microbacterium sp. NPDC077057 TaxID=3154763 RepID=UPI003444397D